MAHGTENKKTNVLQVKIVSNSSLLCGDNLADDKNAELAPVKTTTKRRGRPKKQLKEAEEEQEPPPEKRRRGRPRKKAEEAEQEP